MLYKTTGIVRYKGEWVIIDVHNSIAKYYNWWVGRLSWKKGSTPYHGAHVTVLNGLYQKPAYYANWGKYEGQEIEVEYDSVVYTNDYGYYWLKVYTPWIKKIRNELGLSDTPKWHPHITVSFVNT
jgi:hypothetical protein